MPETVATASVDASSTAMNEAVADLADDMEKIAVVTGERDTPAGTAIPSEQQQTHLIYTRKQLVHLSQSPLVKPPDGMPLFKAWFGDWNEQNGSTKKDVESTNVGGGLRERRFRREAEDGDSTRPSFRSALSSQPSQMGNFKHQPLRPNNDRDRDTGDLRTLSDKFDREKRGVGLPSHSTLLRNREKDSAPHLASERDSQQRTGLKKRNGETDDWRRGGESTRNGRDDPLGRRERNADTSRHRESPPLNRRDKDDTRRDRDRFNDGDDDNRRWRDDGKRRGGRDRSRDLRDEEGWTIHEERRRGGRDRKLDDVRDRDDRREREKEKEPAWMETYVPASSSAGILGGKGADGEVDDIQAWKKDMKERELKAKAGPNDVALEPLEPIENSREGEIPKPSTEGQLDEIQLFKLMMKKEEQKRASGTATDVASDPSNHLAHETLHDFAGAAPGLSKVQDARQGESKEGFNGDSPMLPSGVDTMLQSLSTVQSAGPLSTTAQSPIGLPAPTSSSQTSSSIARTESSGSRFLSLGASEPQSATSRDIVSPVANFDPPRQSRLLAFGAQNAKASPQSQPQESAQLTRLQSEVLPSTLRRPSASPTIPVSASHQSILEKPRAQQQSFGGLPELHGGDELARRMMLSSGSTPLSLENGRISNPNLPEFNRDFRGNDALRSAPISGFGDRGGYLNQSDVFQSSDIRRNATPPNSGFSLTSPVSPFEGQPINNQTTYSTGKGSRMAKHFVDKQRDPGIGMNRLSQGQNPGMNIPLSRVEQPSFNNAGPGGKRDINDLLAMLNNSAQRGNQVFDQGYSNHGPPVGHLGPSPSVLNRHDSMSDPEEGRFAPDGLVPGLRPAPPRNRDVGGGGVYNNPLDDLNLNPRMGLQRGGMDQMLPNPVQAQFNGQAMNLGRNGGLPQQMMRNGQLPMNNFAGAQGLPQQRLPPGLANLGGRPPHEPTQFLGSGAGGFNNIPPQFQGGLPQHVAATQGFNGLQNPNLAALSNQGLMRGQPGLGQLGQLGNGLGDLPSGSNARGGPNGPMQNQMLGLGVPNVGQGIRGGPPFNNQQLHGSSIPGVNLRQHQVQPQLMQHLLPQQMHGIPGGQPNPNDLIALLMGEGRRD